MTKRRQIKNIIVRVLGDYGFDAESAERIAEKLTSEIYNLVPARITSNRSASADTPPEVELFKQVTGFYPAGPAYQEVIALVTGKTVEQLQKAYTSWCFAGKNPKSATWLKWVGDKTEREVVVS